MSRVHRRELVFDQELGEQNLRRIYETESVIVGGRVVPIYREAIVPNDGKKFERVPWWKRTKTRRPK